MCATEREIECWQEGCVCYRPAEEQPKKRQLRPRQPEKRPPRSPEKQPPRQPEKRPTRQPEKRPTRQSVKQPPHQSVKQPTRQPEKRPTRQSVKQPPHQSVKQPTRQPEKRPPRSPEKRPRRQSAVTLSEQEFIQKALVERESGLEIRNCGRDSLGKGVFTVVKFKKNEYVCKYQGEKISMDEYQRRITCDESRNIYCMVVKRPLKRDTFVLDANDAPYKHTFGRTINHDRTEVNIRPAVRQVREGRKLKNPIVVYFKALRDIEVGEELAYDYNDWRRDTDLDKW